MKNLRLYQTLVGLRVDEWGSATHEQFATLGSMKDKRARVRSQGYEGLRAIQYAAAHRNPFSKPTPCCDTITQFRSGGTWAAAYYTPFVFILCLYFEVYN